MKITEEAIEALAKRNFDAEYDDGREWEALPDPVKRGWRKEAREQCEAVAPYMTSKPE